MVSLFAQKRYPLSMTLEELGYFFDSVRENKRLIFVTSLITVVFVVVILAVL